MPIAILHASYRGRIAALSAGAVLVSALVTSGGDLHVAAVTGQRAPGTPPGAVFSSFGSAMFDGAPSIGADSSIGFAGILSDGTKGFWVDHGAGPELLALSGTRAPGTEPGVVFSQRVAEIVLVTPPLLVPGHAVLSNTLVGPGVGFGNDEGIWHSAGAGLTLVMREGMSFPARTNVQLSRLSLRALDRLGRAVVTTSLTGAVVADNDECLWRASPDASLELLAREGDAAPGAGFGVVFATATGAQSAFPFVAGNSAGDVLFVGGLHGPGTGTGNDEALFLHDAAGTRLLLREGDAVPGMPGFVLQGDMGNLAAFGAAFADDGHFAITAMVTNGVVSAGVLFADGSAGLAALVRPGDPAPGTSGRFDILGSPSRNVRSEVAFLASTVPSATRPPLGLWIAAAGGLRAVAVPGAQLPGQPVATLLRDVVAVNGLDDAGSVLFTAELELAGGAPGGVALLFADPDGAITVIARTGEQLAVAAGDLRTVAHVGVRRNALGSDAHVAFAAEFTDGSAAEIVAGIASQVVQVGPGTAGKGAFVPALSVSAAHVGSSPSIAVTNATGGAPGVLGLAAPDDPLQPDRFATFGFGCGQALAASNLALFANTLSGAPGAAGEGSFVLPLASLPPELRGTTWYLQAAYLDFEAPCGVIALTGIVRVRVD